jgi:uridine kinase
MREGTMGKILSIAISGHNSTGKTTLSKKLAKKPVGSILALEKK